jgi:two-component system, cell cycle sensor histidine kinase and response regulator CckA
MFESEVIRVLLVEDDEDDYLITKGLFAELQDNRYQLEWFKSYELGLQAMVRNQHDVCLIDYRLGAKNGIELLKQALEEGCHAPIIMLTGRGEHHIDMEAMRAGAADYLVKTSLHSDALGRSVRYAIERRRAAARAAFEQASIAAMGADVGLAITQREPLDTILYHCAEAMARYLNVYLVRIWTFEPEDEMLQLRASSGAVNEIASKENPLPRMAFSLQLIADGKPVLVQKAAGDARVPCQELVRNEKIVSYAGYPLLLDNRLVGLMAVFSMQPLTPAIVQQMGSIANGIALCIDTKRSEEVLDARESGYRAAVEDLAEVVFQVDEFGNWTSLNPAWTAITGFKINDTLGNLFLEYLHHDDRQRNSFIFLQLIERKLDFTRHETRILTKDGKVRWVEIYAQLTLNSDGTILGASGSFTDITERKQDETQIQKAASFPRTHPNPVLEFDAEGSLTHFNDAALALAKSVGFSHPMALLPPTASDISRQCLTSNQNRLREEVRISDRTISWSFFPVAASQVVHCYGADITEVLHLEAQFRHAQKLESVGQLVAGVAHDFNNILTVIQGYSDRLLKRCDGDANLVGPLKQISGSTRRASTLTRQLLLISRKQIMQSESVELNTLLHNLSNMLTRLLGEDIAVETRFASGLPAFEADPGMIEQIVMNLAVNARDAMPKGGRFLITTSLLNADKAYVQAHPDSRPGKAVCLAVEDTGCGMTAETLSRIFEPFFTTKELGKGSGLGLATVYGLIKQHNGWVEVKSQPDAGTTFNIFFPAGVTAHEPESSEVGKPQAGQGQNETILLVEDEPVLREWVKEVLQTNSYRVLEASNGQEALNVWDGQAGKIDLLLTDMVMPEGMTGRDLARQLRVREPKLKVIYTSGFSSEVAANDPELHDIPFLSKPFPAPQLTQLVRSCLDARSVQV